MAVQFDNSTESNLSALSPRTGEGVVIDIGTGDGRFVSAAARKNPAKFYIGIDANVKPLEKISMKAARKPSKGGLPNALFVQAAVEDLPDELKGVANEIHIHFPWGSLLRSVTTGDSAVLKALHGIASPECLLEVVIGLDLARDRGEIERLGVPDLSNEFLTGTLMPLYRDAGFKHIDSGAMTPSEWSRLDTSWARKLRGGTTRRVTYLIFQAT